MAATVLVFRRKFIVNAPHDFFSDRINVISSSDIQAAKKSYNGSYHLLYAVTYMTYMTYMYIDGTIAVTLSLANSSRAWSIVRARGNLTFGML